jgi:hypothetical protein
MMRLGVTVTPDRKELRFEQAAEISLKMNAARIGQAPPAAEDHMWSRVFDKETNKPSWYPKALHDEYQRLRFTEEGLP